MRKTKVDFDPVVGWRLHGLEGSRRGAAVCPHLLEVDRCRHHFNVLQAELRALGDNLAIDHDH
jgi:hypothetical protein